MKFAILGIHPELSKAELTAVTKADLISESDQSALFDVSGPLNDLQKRLGGSSKLGDILGSVKDAQEIEKHLITVLREKAAEKKLNFGISVYSLGDDKRTKEIQKFLYKTGIHIKRAVKDSGKSVRLVSSKETTLSSVVVAKNKLTTEGIEFCVLVKSDEILIGQTKTYQDFEDWSHRDYDRPRRNAKNGMLPPKLARMMINLAGLSTEVEPPRLSLLDPFCGSGTVLMEAAVLGFKNITGSDISEKIISDAKVNLDWLIEKGYASTTPEIFTADVRALSKRIESSSIDVIVTEPFLGTPRQGDETAEHIEKTVDELAELLKDGFEIFDKILRSGGICVIAAPVHMYKNKPFPVPVERLAADFNLIPQEKPLRYAREGQFVERDIWVLKHQP